MPEALPTDRRRALLGLAQNIRDAWNDRFWPDNGMAALEAEIVESCRSLRIDHPSPAARAIRNNPAPTTTAPIARAVRSSAGARRSTVMAAAMTAITGRSMTPTTRRIAVRPAQQ
jgi:hypothetical protein